MYQTPEHFAAANKSAVDALLASAHAALAGAERISSLNFNAARAALEDGSAMALLATRDPKEAATMQSALVQPSVERAVSYSRSMCEIAAETQQQFAKQAEARFGDFQKQFTALVEQAAKNTPAGSDAAVSAVKTVFAAATSAFDRMNTAAQQFAEAAERNVAAAGDASVAAVKKSVGVAKRK